MLFLNYIDRLPDKIFHKLKPQKINGTLIFPCKICREPFHILGSILFISISHILFLFFNKSSPIVIFVFLSLWITYQEFYLHPKKYNQKLIHGIFDWIAWIIPFIFYLYILYF